MSEAQKALTTIEEEMGDNLGEAEAFFLAFNDTDPLFLGLTRPTSSSNMVPTSIEAEEVRVGVLFVETNDTYPSFLDQMRPTNRSNLPPLALAKTRPMSSPKLILTTPLSMSPLTMAIQSLAVSNKVFLSLKKWWLVPKGMRRGLSSKVT